jgi:hypothetical protein
MRRFTSRARLLVAALTGIVSALACIWAFNGSSLGRKTRWQYRVLSSAQVIGLTRTPELAPLMDTTSGPGIVSPAMGDLIEKSMNGELQQRSENTLNRLGAEGYELCAVSDGYYIFKRPNR